MSRFMRTLLAGASLLAWKSLPIMAQPPTIDDPGIQQLMGMMNESGATSRRSENGAVEAAPQRNDVSVVAGKDKSLAKITLTQELASGRLIGTLATPINMKDDATQFFTLDGPAEDVQLGIAWKKQSYNTLLFSQVDLPEQKERRDAICDKFKVPTCSDTELENAMKKVGSSSAEIARTLKNFNAVKLAGTNRALPLFRAIPFRDSASQVQPDAQNANSSTFQAPRRKTIDSPTP